MSGLLDLLLPFLGPVPVRITDLIGTNEAVTGNGKRRNRQARDGEHESENV